ncbi:hypothetical protein BJ165DRAFT_1313548, partial [Panaeolus papilionaceus]
LADVFQKVLEDFGIQDKVLGIASDNATNNDVMMSSLEDKENSFSSVNRTRCFLHVTNL